MDTKYQNQPPPSYNSQMPSSAPYPPPNVGAYAPPPFATPVQNMQQPPTSVIVTHQVAAQPQGTVVVVGSGSCPRCGVGFIVSDFSCCGIFLAIFFFPIGILCCLLMRTQHCNRCGYSV